MSAIQQQISITPDQLFRGIEQLDQTQLAWLSARLDVLRQEKRAEDRREARIGDLLQLINRTLPPKAQADYDLLNNKFQQQTLTENEYQRLLQYVQQIEQLNAERVAYMIELAELWGVTIQQVASRLGFERQPYVIQD